MTESLSTNGAANDSDVDVSADAAFECHPARLRRKAMAVRYDKQLQTTEGMVDFGRTSEERCEAEQNW